MRTLTRTLLIALAPLVLLACGGPPTELLKDVSTTLSGSALARKCAPEEYAAADRMFKKAQKQIEAGDHDEAEVSLKAAKQLALKAQQKAEARREECEAPKVDPNTDLSDLTDKSGPGLDATDGDSGGMKTVYFDYNAFDLTPQAKDTMARNATWMRNNPSAQVTIEGHCDNRGSTEYNLALGEKRGQIVRKYFTGLGVDPGRLSVVSYGEEQPTAFGETEADHARNRRAEFRIR